MRILHVTDTSVFNFDGISTYVNELLECSGRTGDEACVWMPPPLRPEPHRKIGHLAGIRVFPKVGVFSSRRFVVALPVGLRREWSEFRPDLVWIHTVGPLGVVAARLAAGRCPILYTKHCFDGDLWIKNLGIRPSLQHTVRRLAFKMESWVLAGADRALHHFEDRSKIENRKYLHKFTYLPPPLSIRFLQPRSRAPSGIRDDGFTVGFCGRLEPEKGLEELFEAVDRAQAAHPSRKTRLLLIGDGVAGRALQRQYAHLEVAITGFVDDVVPHLDALDAFVLSSKTETTSLSCLEAYARGLPIFSRRVGFLGLRPRHHRNIFNFETATELAALLKTVLPQARRLAPLSPETLDPQLITFSQLYDAVIPHEKNGAMPSRCEIIAGRTDSRGDPWPSPALRG